MDLVVVVVVVGEYRKTVPGIGWARLVNVQQYEYFECILLQVFQIGLYRLKIGFITLFSKISIQV